MKIIIFNSISNNEQLEEKVFGSISFGKQLKSAFLQ
jgi:hypothetical protein